MHYWLEIIDTRGDVTAKPFAAPSGQQAVRDALAYLDGLRAAGFDDLAHATVTTLEIGRYNPVSGEIETRRERSLYDSLDPDSTITVTDLPVAVTRPACDASRLGLCHGQRPDPRPVVAAHAAVDLAEFFEEQELAEMGITARDRFRRRGEE